MEGCWFKGFFLGSHKVPACHKQPTGLQAEPPCDTVAHFRPRSRSVTIRSERPGFHMVSPFPLGLWAWVRTCYSDRGREQLDTFLRILAHVFEMLASWSCNQVLRGLGIQMEGMRSVRRNVKVKQSTLGKLVYREGVC